mgnify:FL=1
MNRQFQREFNQSIKATFDQGAVTKDYTWGLFRAADPTNSGYIGQLAMKDIIEQLGVKLTPTEFSQVARMFSANADLNIKYT